MTMITPSYLGETIEYSSLHACRSTLEDPTVALDRLRKRRVDLVTLDRIVVAIERHGHAGICERDRAAVIDDLSAIAERTLVRVRAADTIERNLSPIRQCQGFPRFYACKHRPRKRDDCRHTARWSRRFPARYRGRTKVSHADPKWVPETCVSANPYTRFGEIEQRLSTFWPFGENIRTAVPAQRVAQFGLGASRMESASAPREDWRWHVRHSPMLCFESGSPLQSLRKAFGPATSAWGPVRQTSLHSNALVRPRGIPLRSELPHPLRFSRHRLLLSARSSWLSWASRSPFLRKIAVTVPPVKTRSCESDQLTCTKGQVTL